MSSDIETLPIEILSIIFEFLPQKKQNSIFSLKVWKHCEQWRSVLLTSRRFNAVGKICFDPSVFANRAIRWACKYEKIQVVQYLLKDPRVNPSVQDNSLLINAIQKDNLPIVQELLKHPMIDPSKHDCLAVKIACDKLHVQIIAALLEHPKILERPLDLYCLWEAGLRSKHEPFIQYALNLLLERADFFLPLLADIAASAVKYHRVDLLKLLYQNKLYKHDSTFTNLKKFGKVL